MESRHTVPLDHAPLIAEALLAFDAASLLRIEELISSPPEHPGAGGEFVTPPPTPQAAAPRDTSPRSVDSGDGGDGDGDGDGGDGGGGGGQDDDGGDGGDGSGED